MIPVNIYIEVPVHFNSGVARHTAIFCEKKYLRYADPSRCREYRARGIDAKVFSASTEDAHSFSNNIHRIDDEYDENALEVKVWSFVYRE